MCMVRAQTNNTNATTEVQRLNQVNVCHLVGNDLKAGFFFSDLLGGALHGTLGPVAPYLWVFFFFFFFFFSIYLGGASHGTPGPVAPYLLVFFFFFFFDLLGGASHGTPGPVAPYLVVFFFFFYSII